MAVLTSITKLHEGERKVSFKIVGLSDSGTEEVNVPKILLTDVSPPAKGFKILQCLGSTNFATVQLLFIATISPVAVIFRNNETISLDFTKYGGIPNIGGPGSTGALGITTTGANSNEGYLIVVELEKIY